MGTEADKTNTAVIATMFAVGAAAMLAGSAAVVALARGEVREFSEQNQAYADLAGIQRHRAGQAQQLTRAKLPIDKARSLVLRQIKRDPNAASPFTPPPEPDVAAGGAAGEDGAAAGGAAAAPGAGGAAAPSGMGAPAPANDHSKPATTGALAPTPAAPQAPPKTPAPKPPAPAPAAPQPSTPSEGERQ